MRVGTSWDDFPLFRALRRIKLQTVARSIFTRLREMPPFLRFVLFPYSLIGSILFIDGSFVPIVDFELKGKQVSWFDWWVAGAGPLFVVIGFLLFISAYGFYGKKRYARLTFLAVFVVALLFIRQFEMPTMTGMILMGILFLVAGWYLFFKKNVRSYFESSETRH
jgi:uncharacterized membrane protein HdeD (DUF308 family)